MSVYAVVFPISVGAWYLARRFFATPPVVTEALRRRRHVLLAPARTAIGLLIVIDGGSFRL
ncbi:hypothetical protein O3Q52_35815 [Streptomyces sp. ActVer]|uniref:hypothetical protein n=1 Tax=Streptomyces sp. ActVer TaxID=3014558 RepID=UPI0022B2BDCF|nr:hypothetical protein [Streptomyces sp. ActVer]MCZ4513423.1 hypothetical protein [Streptomyces sp. ActVer]